MVLLGKTLKGRTTKPGGNAPQRNIQIRQISKSSEELDINLKLSKIKRDTLKQRLQDESVTFKLNQKKLLTYWRKLMRIAKTE
jgi:hypothetical protein